MAQLFTTVSQRSLDDPGAPPPPPPSPALPGLGPLDEAGLLQQRVLAVQSALHRIRPVASDSGLEMPTADDLIALGPRLAGVDGCQSVTTLHQHLIQVLSAASPPVGNAYQLGNALTALCGATAQGAGGFASAVHDGRIDAIRNLVNSLRSILPPHAGQGVRGALNNWEDWLAAGNDANGPEVALALHTQGDQWFAMLAGQKAAVDLLTIDNYVDAGEALLKQYRKLAQRFAAQWWPYLVAGLVIAVAIVGLLFRYGHGDTKGLGTIATLLASLGVTAKAATATLEKTAASVEDSLWQAELDNAIILAATGLPQGAKPVIGTVTRPLQRKERQAAAEARQSRHEAIASRAAAQEASPTPPAGT
jgi:hypothetical protein